MSGALDIVSYFASRASRSAANVRQGARRAVSIAYEVLWAPVTISKAIISIGLGLPPVRALVLAPLLLLQRSCSGGKLITFTLLDASGKVTCTQPVWAQWSYDVAGLLELLEKHLQLQGKELWIESLGSAQKGIFQDFYQPLPLTATVREFALPFITLAAMVEDRPSAAVDVMLTTNAPLGLEKSPDASPDKLACSSREFFSLPADASFGARRLLLASHPIPATLMDGSSDADSPIHSPISNPDKSPFSPFT